MGDYHLQHSHELVLILILERDATCRRKVDHDGWKTCVMFSDVETETRAKQCCQIWQVDTF